MLFNIFQPELISKRQLLFTFWLYVPFFVYYTIGLLNQSIEWHLKISDGVAFFCILVGNIVFNYSVSKVPQKILKNLFSVTLNNSYYVTTMLIFWTFFLFDDDFCMFERNCIYRFEKIKFIAKSISSIMALSYLYFFKYNDKYFLISFPLRNTVVINIFLLFFILKFNILKTIFSLFIQDGYLHNLVILNFFFCILIERIFFTYYQSKKSKISPYIILCLMFLSSIFLFIMVNGQIIYKSYSRNINEVIYKFFVSYIQL